MYDSDTKDTEPSAGPKGKEVDADVRTDDVDDPVWGEWCDAEDDEERDDIVFLLAKFFGPTVETGLPLGKGEEGGAKGSTNEIAECSASCDAGAGEGEGDGHAPDCTTEDGEIHGAWERESLEAREGK